MNMCYCNDPELIRVLLMESASSGESGLYELKEALLGLCLCIETTQVNHTLISGRIDKIEHRLDVLEKTSIEMFKHVYKTKGR